MPHSRRQFAARPTWAWLASLGLFLVWALAPGVTAADAPEGMVLIPAGEFQMGRAEDSDDAPFRQVKLNAFYLETHEVTNAQYQAFCVATDRDLPMFWGMDEFRSGQDFPDHPVIGVNWSSAQAYAEWAGKRLPTEAEWEYAARGGLVGLAYPNGADIDTLQANYRAEGPKPVGSYPPNGYGLYDMAGNVREWVLDYYHADYYRTGPTDNPQGPEKTKFRVVRGGGWYSGPSCQSVDYRWGMMGSWVDFNVGFRCAQDVD